MAHHPTLWKVDQVDRMVDNLNLTVDAKRARKSVSYSKLNISIQTRILLKMKHRHPAPEIQFFLSNDNIFNMEW